MPASSGALTGRRMADAIATGSDHLSLSGLGLRDLPVFPEVLSGLRGLNLSGNRLKRLPAAIARLDRLEWLDLSNNRFEALPPEIGALRELASLDLSENRLTTVAPEIRQLGKLVELSLFHNRLSELPESILALVSLARLDLAANRLTQIPLIDRPAPLRTLDLSRNELADVPAGLRCIGGLRALNLAGNRIVSAEGIDALAELEELDLSMNRLTDPPRVALALSRLRVLEADGNPFGALPGALRDLGGSEIKARAASEIARHLSGGMEQDKHYFEPVSFVFGFVIAIGGLAGVSLAIDRFYKRFDGASSVVLEFPSGTKVSLANLSRARALEFARQHEADLEAGAARLHFGDVSRQHLVEESKAIAVDVLTRVPSSSLVPQNGAAVAQQFIIYNGPTYSPVMHGPSAKEEIMGDKISISDTHNSVINVKSTLDHVTQSIGSMPIEQTKKDELKTLVEQFNEALKRVPPEKRQEAEAVAELLKDAMDKLARPAPHKKTIEFSLKGLLSAAKDLAEVAPVAVKLGAAIAGLFGLAL